MPRDAPTPAQMGLDDPRATLSFHHGEIDTTLKLGKHTLGGSAYVQIEGEDTAYIVENTLHGAVLDQTIKDWRKTSLDLPDASGADSAAFYPADGNDLLIRKTDGQWHFDTESKQRASHSAIDGWLSEVKRLWINDFVEDNPDNFALYGLANDYARIVITEPGKEEGAEVTHTLYIGNTDLEGNNRYAAFTTDDEQITVIFTISTASADSLTRSDADLRDPQVIPADIYDVRELTVEQHGRTTLHLLLEPQSGYSFGEPAPGYDADYITTHDMVQKLCELQSTEYVEEVSTLGTPAATVAIKLADADRDVVFSIYDQGDIRAVVNEGESIAYLVPADSLDTLLGSTLALRDRTVFGVESASIARMTLKRDDGQVFVFEPMTGDDQTITWKLQGFDSVELDAVAALPELLNPLKAKSWLSEPVEPMGDWIEWTIEPVGGAPLTLKASPATGHALMTGIDTAFVLPQDVLDKLKAEFRGRTVLNIDINQIESIKLASNVTNVTLSRNGRQYTIDVGKVDQAQAAAVFDTLSGLQADRYTQAMSLLPQDIDFGIELTTADDKTITLNVVRMDSPTVTVSMESSQDTGYKGWFQLSREVVNPPACPTDRRREPDQIKLTCPG